MPPCESNRYFNNNPPIPLPPPPSHYDPAIFQATITAVVAAAITQINASGTSGAGSGAHNSIHEESIRHPRECSYKDFSNAKPKYFDGTGGIIALTCWYEKTESVFEIYAFPEANKVKFVACTFLNRSLSCWNG